MFKSPGFTLLETIIYVAIVALVLAVGINLLFNVIATQSQHEAHLLLKDEAQFALEKVSFYARNAKSIVSPEDEGTSLELAMDDTEINPTRFETREDKVAIKQGDKDWVELTSDKTQAVNLSFTNLTPQESEGVVQISLTLQSFGAFGREPQITVQTTVTLRE